MSERVMSFSVLHLTPDGSKVFELLEQEAWVALPFRAPQPKSVALFKLDADGTGPWPVAADVDRRGWRFDGHARHSAWRLMRLAEKARLRGRPQIATELCYSAVLSPRAMLVRPTVLQERERDWVRGDARRLRRAMVALARERDMDGVLLLSAASRIVRSDLLLVRMMERSSELEAYGARRFTINNVASHVIRRLADAFTQEDLEHVRESTCAEIRLIGQARRLAAPPGDDAATAVFLGDVHRYVDQAWAGIR